MLILSILIYAAPAWCYIPKTVFKSLQVVQNKALRIINASDWYTRNSKIHDDLHVKILHILLKEHVAKFYNSIDNHENTFIKDLGHYNPGIYKKFRTPKSFIY